MYYAESLYSIILPDYGIEFGLESTSLNPSEKKGLRAYSTNPAANFFLGLGREWSFDDAEAMLTSSVESLNDALQNHLTQGSFVIATELFKGLRSQIVSKLIELADKDIAPSIMKDVLCKFLTVSNKLEDFARLGIERSSRLWDRATQLTDNFGILQELIAQWHTINALPELMPCAYEKFPDETKILDDNKNFLKMIFVGSAGSMSAQSAGSFENFWKDLTLSSICDGINERLRRTNWEAIDNLNKAIYALNSTCVKEEKQRLIDEGYFESNCQDAPNQIDPSGYVYETVPSNRLQGVKATCYQKVETENMYGDIIEKAVVWDARNYEQENPLLTDEQGLYRWDVPEGLWQVKFEKEGYETTYTDWLPVPPPQLDINIPIIQYSQPKIVKAEWTEEGVNIYFSKYMLPSTINANNIIVEFDGDDICGNIELANEEINNEADHSFASSIKVIPNCQLGEKDVIDLTVKGNVKSYAGIALGEDVSFKLSRIPTVTEYIIPDSISLLTDEQKIIHIKVLSKEASNGKALSISNSFPMICHVDEMITLDDNGEGDIYVTGSLPGSSTIILAIDGFNKSKQISIVVSDFNDNVVAMPYASVDDSAPIIEGTEVFLFCDTESASIYYTIDGSCPCDYDKRIRYDGTPIVLDKPLELKIMACKPGYEDSEIATYHYTNITSSISDIHAETSYSVYPKSTKDYVYLKLCGDVASRVSVWNVDGGLIQTKTHVPDSSRINLTNVPSGIYIITIDINGHRYSERVVKQ